MTPEDLKEVIEAIKAEHEEHSRASIKTWLKGALRSWTVWWSAIVGTLITSWPEVQAFLEVYVFPMLSESTRALSVRIVGFVVLVIGIAIRQKTNKSLVAKGAA